MLYPLYIISRHSFCNVAHDHSLNAIAIISFIYDVFHNLIIFKLTIEKNDIISSFYKRPTHVLSSKIIRLVCMKKNACIVGGACRNDLVVDLEA